MDSWDGRNVFLTGGSGLLGFWIVEGLIEKGAAVTCLIRDDVHKSRFFTSPLMKEVNIVRGGLEDYQLIQRSINEYEIDTVFHIAAQAIVGTAVRSPISTFETNIRGTWNILESCRQVETIKRVVVASSDKAYGTHEQLPYTEDFALRAGLPYGTSKSCADLIAQSYALSYGLPVGITRCANLYGGGDLNWSRIVPGTMKSVIEKKPVIVRSDGEFMRDFLYLRDAVDAYLTLADKLSDKKVRGQAFNFGNGTPIKMIDIVNKIIDVSKKKDVDLRILNEVKAEIKDQYVSSEKANEILGWKPSFTMDTGLSETLDWYEKFLKS